MNLQIKATDQSRKRLIEFGIGQATHVSQRWSNTQMECSLLQTEADARPLCERDEVSVEALALVGGFHPALGSEGLGAREDCWVCVDKVHALADGGLLAVSGG